MKITEEVKAICRGKRDSFCYEALHVGMKEKANEFKDSGGEIYNSAPST